MKKPILSIICNTYNHEKYIDNALKSFIDQKTEYDFEILVHDDASTDNTTTIIKKYEKKYPTIIKPIYQKENQFSKGVKIDSVFQFCRAKGKYIAFCEGDDCWTDNNKIQICVSFLEKHPDYVAVFHKTALWNVESKSIMCQMGLEIDDSIEVCDYSFSNALSNLCHTSSFVIRKEIVLKDKPQYFYSLKKVSDYPMKIFLTQSGKVAYINKTMSMYRYLSNKESYSYKIRESNTNKDINLQFLLDHRTMMKSIIIDKTIDKSKRKITKNKLKQVDLSIFYITKSPFFIKEINYFNHSICGLIRHVFDKI